MDKVLDLDGARAVAQRARSQGRRVVQANGCFDKIVGFVPSRMDGYPNGTLSGYTYGPPASLVWTSDLSGQIGTGQIVIGRPFVIGQHTITLTATNSGGVSTSKSVQVTVVPPRRRP